VPSAFSLRTEDVGEDRLDALEVEEFLEVMGDLSPRLPGGGHLQCCPPRALLVGAGRRCDVRGWAALGDPTGVAGRFASPHRSGVPRRHASDARRARSCVRLPSAASARLRRLDVEAREASADKAHEEAAAEHREDLATSQVRLLEENTALTERIGQLSEEIDELTRSIHARVVDAQR
jgi:hypothetical protein